MNTQTSLPVTPAADEVAEIVPLDEGDARHFVGQVLEADAHPDVIALRERQEEDGTFGTAEGAAEMRSLLGRLGY